MVGVTGSIPVVPTIQSSRTAETVVDRKEAVSAGIAVAYSERFRSLPTLTVLPGFFELQSQHPKIPFPATEFRDETDRPALRCADHLPRRETAGGCLGRTVQLQTEAAACCL